MKYGALLKAYCTRVRSQDFYTLQFSPGGDASFVVALLHACVMGLRSERQEERPKQPEPLNYTWEDIDHGAPGQAHITLKEHFESKGLQHVPQTVTAEWLLGCLKPFKNLSSLTDHAFSSPADNRNFEHYAGLLMFLMKEVDEVEISAAIPLVARFLQMLFREFNALNLCVNARNIDRFLRQCSMLSTPSSFLVCFFKKEAPDVDGSETVVSESSLNADEGLQSASDVEMRVVQPEQKNNVILTEEKALVSPTIAFWKKEDGCVYFDPGLEQYVSCTVNELKSLLIHHVLTGGYYSEFMRIMPLTKSEVQLNDAAVLKTLNSAYFNDFIDTVFSAQDVRSLEKTFICDIEQETEDVASTTLVNLVLVVPSFFIFIRLSTSFSLIKKSFDDACKFEPWY